jgi:hypothetical protein
LALGLPSDFIGDDFDCDGDACLFQKEEVVIKGVQTLVAYVIKQTLHSIFISSERA